MKSHLAPKRPQFEKSLLLFVTFAGQFANRQSMRDPPEFRFLNLDSCLQKLLQIRPMSR